MNIDCMRWLSVVALLSLNACNAKPGEEARRAASIKASAPAAEQPPAAGLQQRLGPFTVGGHQYLVVADRMLVDRDTSVTQWRVLDEQQRVHFEHRYERTPDDDAMMTAHVMGADTLSDDALSIHEESYPSAPLTGASLRLLVPRNGRLVELVPPLMLFGNFEGFAKGIQHVMVWRYEYGLKVPLALDFACTPGSAECVKARPRATEPNSGLGLYHVETYLRKIEEQAVVTLYAVPRAASGEAVTVTPATQVQVLEAAARVTLTRDGPFLRVNADQDWLHVRIDGREGWITSSADFMAVGLPSAG